MIHCYQFHASPVISKPRYFELFFHFPWDFEIAGFNCILKFWTSPETGNEQISTWTAYKDNWGWQRKFRGKFSKDNGLRPLKIWNDQQCYNLPLLNTNIVDARLTASSVIQSPRYNGHFFWPLGKNNHTLSCNCPDGDRIYGVPLKKKNIEKSSSQSPQSLKYIT